MNARSVLPAAQAGIDDTCARILEQIKGHCSKKPARADEVAALVRGKRSDYQEALEHLVGSHQVATATIKRQADPAPWMAIWPTGVRPRVGKWGSTSHGSLFGGQRTPAHLPQSPDPTRDPRPDLGYASRAPRAAAMKEEHIVSIQRTNPRRDQAVAMIAGRNREHAIARKEIAAGTGLSTQGAASLCDVLEKHGLAQTFVVGGGSRRTVMVFDPKAKADDVPAQEPAAQAPAAKEFDSIDIDLANGPRRAEESARDQLVELQPSNDPGERCHFALFCNGELALVTGGLYVVVSPADTKRLAALLGVGGGAA